jgi:tetratricopeptide (TPR) repeat protein
VGVVILVAEFEQPEGGSGRVTETAQELYRTLLAQARSAGVADWAQIEQASSVVAREGVASAAQEYNAGYVIWGSGEGQAVSAYVTRIHRAPAAPLSSQARRLTLSIPSESALCGADTGAATDFILGIAAYRCGEMEQAASLLSEILATAETDQVDCSPLLAHTHLYLGNVAALDSEYDTALTHYETGLGLTSSAADQALFYTNQSSIDYAQERNEAALTAATLAVEQAPDLANAYYHRANAHRALGQIEDAQSDLDRALTLDPGHARAYASRGLLHHNAEEFEEALQDYGRALELDPWAVDVYLNRGGTYATLGELDAAVQDYSLALILQPADADAFYNRGTVYAIQQRYPEALDDFSQALALRPDFSQVYGNRGLVYKALGETDAAIADFEAFLELSDNAQWREMIEGHLAELKQAQE